MKKFLSLMLAFAMLVSVFSVSIFAEDVSDVTEPGIYFDADFSSDTAAAKDFYVGNFKSNGEHLVGYSDAYAFQSVGFWSAYDVIFDVSFAEDDLVDSTGNRGLSYVYINPNMKHNGVSEDNYNMTVYFDITNDEISLVGGSFFNDASADKLADPVPFVLDDNTTYTFGISITEGRIRVFNGDELLIDFVDEENKYYIGYSYEEVEPVILFWWNTAGCTIFEDVKVSSPAYLLPFPKPIMYGDANGDEKISLADVSLMLKHIAKWEGLEMNAEAANVNCDDKISLADVSLMLKYIAKWDGIVLGPAEE